VGRSPRVLIQGGMYHVYNRVSRGERVFRDDAEAERLLALLAETKRRDEFQVLAWCVMSNHYHLAVRMGEVELSRSMRTVHHRFAQSFNGRHRVFGPFWQGRYRSKLVEEGEYLQQLILYIHLNPVVAGLVKDSADYRWSGHGEVLQGRRGRGLVDVDETLAAFASNRRTAIARYRRAMAWDEDIEWLSEGPGRLPWWRLGRPPRNDADDLELDGKRPRIGMDGLSDVVPRPRVELEEFLQRGAECLGCSLDDLRSRKRSAAVVTAREVLAWVGVQLYHLPVREVARGIEKYDETASRLVSRASERRLNDRHFRELVKGVDRAITEGHGK
jgi:putative transposase